MSRRRYRARAGWFFPAPSAVAAAAPAQGLRSGRTWQLKRV